MKKLKYHIKSTALAILFIAVMSCNSDNGTEDLFEETAAERLNEREQEVMNALLASEQGWKVMYFTDNEEFGGFTLLMKFREDGTVDMTSDIDEETALMTSRFDVKLGSTVKLTFSTKNHIHKLVDSYYPEALKGTGFKGSGEFLYYGREDENRLTFKSVRDRETEQIVFEKATAEDWAGTIAANMEVKENIKEKPSDPVFRGIVLTRDGEETLYPFSYDPLRRYVSVSGTTSDGKITDKSFGVGFTPDGLIAYPALEIDGDSFTEFVWNEAEEKFVSQSSLGATAEIAFLNNPVFITDDYLLINNVNGGGHDRFSYRDDTLGETLYTSAGFKQLFDQAREGFYNTQGGRELYRFEILFDDEGEGRIRYLYHSGSSSYSLFHNFTYGVVDKKIVITDNGWDTLNHTESREEALAPLDNVFFNSEGFYVEQVPERFTYTNQVYTFTSAGESSVRFPAYAAIQ